MAGKKVYALITLLAMVFTLFGGIAVNAADPRLPEVVEDDKGHTASGQIDKMVERGVFDLYEDKSFKPNEPATRGMFADMVARVFNQSIDTPSKYSDAKGSKYDFAVSAIDKAGFVPDDMTKDGLFKPNQVITDVEAAAILIRAINYAYQTGASDITKIGIMKPNGKNLTRGDLAVIAYNLYYTESDYLTYTCKSGPGTYKNSELSEEVDDAYYRGARKVVIAPGVYNLYNPATRLEKAGRPSHFGLQDVKDFTLEGYGVKFIGYTPSDGTSGTGKDRCMMLFRECENITIKGFTTDYINLSYTQAEVIKIEENVGSLKENFVTIKIDKGYPDYLDDPEFFPSSLTGVIYDAKTELPKDMGSTFNLSPKRVDGEERTFRCQNYNARTMKFFEVGDLVTIRMNACTGMNTCFQHCRNVSLIDHTIYSGHYGVLNEPTYDRDENGGLTDTVYFKNVKVTYGDKPEGATRKRLISTLADGIHNSYISGDVIMEDCLVEGNMDDLFSLNGRHYMITDKGEAENQYYISGVAYASVARKGDEFAIYDENSNYKGVVKAKEVKSLGSGEYTPPEDSKDINGYEFTGFLLVTFEDTDLDIQLKDFAFDVDASAGHYTLRNCTMRRSTGRGALLQAWNGLVENCTFDNVKMGIALTGEKTCAQGPYAKDVVVRNCSFTNCGNQADVKTGLYITDGAITTKVEESGRANENIVIDNCYFDNNYSYDILMGNTRNAIITNNTFGGRNSFMDGRVLVGEACVRIDNCENVVFDESNIFTTDRTPVIYQNVDNFISGIDPEYSAEFSTIAENSYDNEWCYEFVPAGTNKYQLYNHQYWSSGTWVRIVPLWSQNQNTNSEYGYFSSQYEMTPGGKNDIVATYNAPFDGRVKISLNNGLRVSEDKFRSNGVKFKIIKNEKENIWPTTGWYALNFGKPVEYVGDIYAEVKKGDKIRFRVNNAVANGEGSVHDLVLFTPEIRYLNPTLEKSEDNAEDDLILSEKYIILTEGETYKLNANIEGCTWRSNYMPVAKVDTQGNVTALRAGVSTIECIKDGVQRDCMVLVQKKVEQGVRIDRRFVSGNIGGTVDLKIETADGLDRSKAVWTSSSKNIVQVDEDGKVTFKGKGEATVTVKIGNNTASTTIVVK